MTSDFIKYVIGKKQSKRRQEPQDNQTRELCDITGNVFPARSRYTFIMVFYGNNREFLGQRSGSPAGIQILKVKLGKGIMGTRCEYKT
jgi:hypothetical protein